MIKIILLILIIYLIYKLREKYSDEKFNANVGCYDCTKKNIYTNNIVTSNFKPWQLRFPDSRKCTTCYNPDKYNKDYESRYENEEIIKYDNNKCQCTTSANSDLNSIY